MIPDDILDAAETGVAALVVTTDAGAPGQFSALGSIDDFEESTQDRGFLVRVAESDPDGVRDVTSSNASAGTGDFFLRFEILMKFINEGRSDRAMSSIIVQDRRRLIDRVPDYVRNNVTGCGEVVHEGGSIQQDNRDPGIWRSSLLFRAEYTDTLVLT